jgi:tetratricopeptide (TPR) repeat protein
MKMAARSGLAAMLLFSAIVGGAPSTGCTCKGPSSGGGIGQPAGPQTRPAPPQDPKAFALVSGVVTQGASFGAIPSVRQLVTVLPETEPSAPSPPLSLTASDGTGLQLVALDARAVLQGPLAFTELHLTFRNPQPREIEGRFAITLPQRAAISRLALKLPAGWQEAEVVERQTARRAYEDVLHRKQDPALLEKKAGNEFSARVFPIPAGGLKEIKLAYSQQLESPATPYRLALRGLPKIDRLRVTVFLSKREKQGGARLVQEPVRLEQTDHLPERDFELAQPAGRLSGLRHENLVVARLKPELSVTRAPFKGLLVLMDTSASRAAGFEAQVRLLGQLVEQLAEDHGPRVRLQVTCFDQVLSTVYRGTLGGFTRDRLGAVLARQALGASDLHGALNWAWTTEGYDRLLLITDGVITAGRTEVEQLRSALRSLKPRFTRADAVLVGGIRDEELMAKLVRDNLDSDGVVLDGDRPAVQIARRLGQSTVSNLEVNIPGARWVWPSRLDGIQPDDVVLVFADIPPDRLPAGKPLPIAITGVHKQSLRVPLAEAPRPLLERAWVRARIERLLQQRDTMTPPDKARAAALDRQIVELSTKHRVLCDLTALLVLESEADYRRYGIARRAQSTILTVGETGLELLQRQAPVYPPARGPAGQKADEAPEVGEAPQPPPASGEAPQPPPASPPGEPAVEKKKVAAALKPPPRPAPAPRPSPAEEERVPPHSGRFAKVKALLRRQHGEQALLETLRWRAESPGDVLALVALGETLARLNRPVLAARAYGSIIDLFPSRADMRRFAAQRLESLGRAGLSLAADSYAEAVRQRPDHPNSHRMLAYALARLGRFERACELLSAGLSRSYPEGRFAGVREIMREDLGLIAAAWAAREPERRVEIAKLLARHDTKLPERPSLRFVLSWETDANDVDFHIRDARGGHAFYQRPQLPSGGRLYADVTTGYGPECFAIPGKARAFPYRLSIHYYRRGPMGYGMGRVQIIQHDGKGGLKYAFRPFVVMNDGAFVELGTVRRPL